MSPENWKKLKMTEKQAVLYQRGKNEKTVADNVWATWVNVFSSRRYSKILEFAEYLRSIVMLLEISI